MNQYARTAQYNHFEIFQISPPFSFFDFIDSRFPGSDPLRRILSQARLHNAKTLVLEKIEKADDLEEENRDIKNRYPAFNNSTSFRISFFKKAFSTKRGLTTTPNSDFIGYAIVKIDEIPSQGRLIRVYESVFHTSRHPNNCIRGAQRWNCQVIGHQFDVDGYLYAQQNDTTNVCAHVALRTAAARYHKNGDMSYHEMNELIGIDHVNKSHNTI